MQNPHHLTFPLARETVAKTIDKFFRSRLCWTFWRLGNVRQARQSITHNEVMPPSIVEKVDMYLLKFCRKRYGWDNQDWRLRWRIIHTIQTWFLASWFLASWRILKSSSLQVSAAKGCQLIDVNFWVLLRMATTTVDSSMHSLDRSAVSNVGDGWQEAVSVVKSVLPGKWMIWKNQDRVLCFSQKISCWESCWEFCHQASWLGFCGPWQQAIGGSQVWKPFSF